MKNSLKDNWPVYLIVFAVLLITAKEIMSGRQKDQAREERPDTWVAPSLYYDHTLEGKERELVIYGEDIISNTSRYFGPQGSVLPVSNGMNCQNCHLQAGKLAFGNNYGAVYSTYPKFRDRSGSIETIPKRVNDCFERSLNGKAIDTNSREMLAIIAYMKWLGKDVKQGEKPKGSGITELTYLDRPADPEKGRKVFVAKCVSCHGANGEGVKNPNGPGFTYPPLWGEQSYNTGAGLFRLSRFAGYVRDNMPFNQASHEVPALTDEEAWDVAAFVNSQPRPRKDLSLDWPDISKKPVDHPFGPYADEYTETQHKFGPFKPIIEARKKQTEQKKLTAQKNN